jgi:hypothetical protein
LELCMILADLILNPDSFERALCRSCRDSLIACANQPTAMAMTRASPPAAVIIVHQAKDQMRRRVGCGGIREMDRDGGGRQIGGGVGVAPLPNKSRAVTLTQSGKPSRHTMLALPISPI